MAKRALKYIALSVIILSTVQMIFGVSVPSGESAIRFLRTVMPKDSLPDTLPAVDAVRSSRVLPTLELDDIEDLIPNGISEEVAGSVVDAVVDSVKDEISDSLFDARIARAHEAVDSLINGGAESMAGVAEQPEEKPDQTIDTTTSLPYKGGSFKEIVHGTSKDSMIFDVKSNKIYVYYDGDVTYGNDMNLKADYMEMDAETKEVYAYGSTDSLGNVKRPVFTDEKGTAYPVDTIHYNLETNRGKMKGIRTQDGDGFFIGRDVKMDADGNFYAAGGIYTTCDLDHPHFYFRLTRAKVIPNKKVITGYAYMVAEDVPIFFPGIPEGFFPMSRGRSSGFIIPSFGEETRKGFFLRGGGYYFALSDHADLTLLGGIYTLGSWETMVASRYVKRYTHQGNLQADYSTDVIGDQGSADYEKSQNFKILWNHTQDAKFRPGSTFSASVQFQSAGYSQKSSTTLNDRINAQTSSSISYSKSWAGTPFSFNTSMRLSQNLQTDQLTVNFPSATFNVSRINPFRKKDALGKQKWYEKIQMSYTARLDNNINTPTGDIFTDNTIKNMRTSVDHTVPISASYNIFNYISVNPSFNYNERWRFRQMNQEYDPVTQTAVVVDTTYGFFRNYDYSLSVGAQTTLYGMYDFSTLNWGLYAVRHVITPNVGFSYNPDFTHPRYGFQRPVQYNAAGDIRYYIPVEGASARRQSASINLSIKQSIEAKVRNKRDTTGVTKVKVIDDLSFSTSYNFMADSLNMDMIRWNIYASVPGLKNVGLRFNGTLDPYQVDVSSGRAVRINKFAFSSGKFPRLATMGTTFGYTFNSKQSANPSAVNSQFSEINPFFFDPDNPIEPAERRMMMANMYYDFSIPWNLTVGYSLDFRNDGLARTTRQNFTFNGSINLTPNMGMTFNFSYDMTQNKFGYGTLTLSRNLHCWQFSFMCNLFGSAKSWSFNISAISPLLSDLKYDKRNNRYDATVFDD